MKMVLAAIGDDGAAQDIVLRHFPVVIGRGETADLRLDDRWVSRRHCRIEFAGGTFLVRDLASRHGTLVNRNHVASAVLMPGDRLTLGMTTFEIRYQPTDRITMLPEAEHEPRRIAALAAASQERRIGKG